MIGDNSVQEYQNRFLSFEQDRLPAVSAVATKFSSVIPRRYLAGLWEAILPRELLWRLGTGSIHSTKRRTAQESFPSWSWAAFNSDPDWFNLANVHTTLEVISIDVQLQIAAAPFGHIEQAILQLKGHLVPMKRAVSSVEQLPRRSNPFDWFSTCEEGLSVILTPNMDAASNVGLDDTLLVGVTLDGYGWTAEHLDNSFCLEVQCRDPDSYQWTRLPSVGLVILPIDDDLETRKFVRIGVFYMGRFDDYVTGEIDWFYQDAEDSTANSSEFNDPQQAKSFFELSPKVEIRLC